MPEKKTVISSSLSSYLTQFSLIILSILIALGVDRCALNQKNDERLAEYLVAMEQELADEAYYTQNNIDDANKDVESLGQGMQLLPQGVDSLTEKALFGVLTTLRRGVFRAFPPMTFELMTSANDAFLIDDFDFRETLASTASFRKDYVQNDLKKYDEMVLEVVDRYGRYVDIGCIRPGKKIELMGCLRDKTGLRLNGGADLLKLQYFAQLRLFHLKRYAQRIKNTQEELAAFKGEPIVGEEE